MGQIPRFSAGASEPAARQAAGLFLLAAGLALAAMSAPHSRVDDLTIIAAADTAIAALAWVAPWQRAGRHSTLVLAFAGLAVLAFSTRAVGGVATGTGPFFVLLYAWLGLHHPAWSTVALAPVTAAAYVWPLVATGQPPEVVGSAIVFVPVTTAVGVVIARRVARLQRACDQVSASERWRAALVATLAHDIRSPLTTVHGALTVLAEEQALSDADRADFLAIALRQTRRMTRLAGGLLDVERVERGRLRLELRDVDLRRAIADAASYVPGATVRIEADTAPPVRADPDRLEQMLVNLITNADRHGTPPIVVSAVPAGPWVRLTVRDHGSGVSDAHLPQLFDRFSDGPDGADRYGARSVGLGLWIVRQLAVAHHGNVHYERAAPGACFVLTLPTAAPLPRSIESPAMAGRLSPTTTAQPGRPSA